MKDKLACAAVFIIFVLGCGNSSSVVQVSSNAIPQNQAVAPEQSNKQTAEESSSASEKGQASPFQPFLIYADKGTRNNHYIPSGFMPDGKCLSLDDAWMENCHGGKSCIKIVYDTDCSKQGKKWAGIYWLNPANNWGGQKGGFNLAGAQKLTFWARGEKGGERLEEIKIGGIIGEYPDSDSAVIGPVILTPEWKEYTIDLRGKDLSSISGGFTWAAKEEVNPQGCTFYLDDIQYE